LSVVFAIYDLNSEASVNQTVKKPNKRNENPKSNDLLKFTTIVQPTYKSEKIKISSVFFLRNKIIDN